MITTDARAMPVAPIELEAGDELPPATIGPITRTDIVRYAGAGGDFHPLHHDAEFARSAGMPDIFAMGMMHAGILGIRLARWVGPANVRSFAARFTAQVWPGDELTLTGRVERVEDGLAHIALRIARQTGELALSASATAVVAKSDI